MDQQRVDSWFSTHTARWRDLYDGGTVDGLVYRHRLERTLFWVDTAGLPPNARALDVGCGAGPASIALARNGHSVEAVDSTAAMVAVAREQVSLAGLESRVKVTVGDAHALEFDDESFDLVVCLGVVPFLHSPLVALRELTRVLRPGGHAIVSFDNRWRLTTLFDPRFTPPLAPVKMSVKRLGRTVGLWRTRPDPLARFTSGRQADALVQSTGLVKVAGATVGFAPFTLLGASPLPARVSSRVDRRLQALADRRVPLVRSGGSHYLILARKPTTASSRN